MDRSRLLSVARREAPADLVLRNARIVNVFVGGIEKGDIAIVADRIAGVGGGYSARQEIDLAGAMVAPGLIDAHVHIESSLCTPAQFARAVAPRGVTTAVIDPHEIANVCGAEGISYMIEASAGLPLRCVCMAPSCVPATGLSTAGAALTAEDLLRLRQRHGRAIHGLAEVMNFPGVITGDAEVMAKLEAFSDRPIDGHCPQVGGAALCAYAAAGIGSDHESISPDEAAEKAARGLHVLIRQASNARNLIPILRAVTPANARRFCFCTDDRHPVDLLDEGSIDMMLRRAIEFGIDPIEAFRMATLNAAECHRLPDRGAIAPGRLADLFVFDELRRPIPRLIMSGGRFVAEDGIATFQVSNGVEPPAAVIGRCIVEWSKLDLRVPVGSGRVRVIGVVPEQLVTECRIRELPQAEGFLRTDPSARILKMAVVERHGRGGGSAVGFVEGIGLARGAIAGTVAHDHHNLVMIGADDVSMLTAARAVAASGGGLAAAVGDRVLAHLPLPVAGLMSDLPVEQVRVRYAALLSAVGELGSPADPFMTMSFMALEVIPALKLTDRGLVDVSKFAFVPLHV